MPLQPNPPFPKTRGHAIRAEDWNEAVNEVIRLDQAKLEKTGGPVSGNLAVSGNLSAGGVISGNLQAGIVGADQIAPGAVRGANIADGTVPVSSLMGGYWHFNTTFTIGFFGQVELAAENPSTPIGSVGAPPTYFSQPLVFMSTSSRAGFFDYRMVYYTNTLNGSDLYGYHSIIVNNRVNGMDTYYLTTYINSLTPPPFARTEGRRVSGQRESVVRVQVLHDDAGEIKSVAHVRDGTESSAERAIPVVRPAEGQTVTEIPAEGIAVELTPLDIHEHYRLDIERGVLVRKDEG